MEGRRSSGSAIAFSVAFADRVRPEPPGQESRRADPDPMRIHVTGATGFLGSELLRLAPGATGERVEIRDAAAVLGCSSASASRRRDPHRLPPGRRRAPARSSSTAPRTSRAPPRRSARGSSTSRPTSSSTAARAAPYVEADPPSPCTEYGRAKADAEERVAAAAPGRPARPHLADRRRPGPRAVEARARGAGPGGDVLRDEIRSPVQVGDLAAAVLELAALELSGPLNVAGADDVSRADLAELVTGPAGPPRAGAAGAAARLLRSTPRAPGRFSRTELRGVREVFRTRA